jgi:hypothetical protein
MMLIDGGFGGGGMLMMWVSSALCGAKLRREYKPDCKKGGMMIEYKKAPEFCCGGQVKMVCENQNER